ncbi:MAG: ATP-binding protein, partial [Balneolaceae bacterium]
MQLLVGLIFGVSFLLPPMQVQDAFPQEYLIRHYDIEDGLPVNSVNGMVQDDAGFLYISTYDGLVRYDGYEFKTYNSGNTPGMETNRIGGLIKSANNTIWLFNENGSISSKNGNVFRIYKSPEIPGTATRITEAKNGIIWISGTEGIAYFDEETAMFKILDEPLLKSYTDLLGTGLHGEVYAINDVGLVSYADNNPSLLLDIKDHPMLGLDIRQIKQFDNEFIWLVGSDIILRYALATGDTRYIEIPNERDVAFWNITPKEHGEFILTSTYGFYRLDAETLDLEKLTLSINANLARPDLVFEGADSEEIFIGDDEIVINGQEVINQVPSIKFGFLDREGSLWVGSLTDGLYQIRKSNFVNLAEPAFPGLVNIYSIIEDDKNSVWACGIAEGIVRISGAKSQNWNHTNSQLSSSFCKFLYQDSNGTIYAILNDRTIWTFNDERWSLVNDFDNTSDVKLETPEALHLSKNRFFFGNQNSLILSENGDFSYFDESQPEALSGIQVFTENSEGVIFAGTSGNGISRIEGDDYIQYSIKNESLTSNIIRDIFLQSDDTLWVATENLGLNRLVLDEKGNVLSSKSITTAEGLTHNSLHRIIEDPYRNLWISSNGGIMRIPKKALNDFADGTTTSFPILSFDEKDGMMNREANGGVQSAGILTNNNQLWFPNQRGITVIDPADFSEGQLIATPTSVFESIETENKLLYFDGKSRNTIPNHERDIRVNFTAPNFAYQDRVHFTYKMDGVNNTWQSADQSRQAVFTGLEPGEYTLEVRVEFIGGDPVETAAVIIIPSRFYETGWFATLMGLALVGLVAGVFKLRIRTLEEREQKLQQRVEEQTIELQKAAEQKSRFFTGITHELKTPLSLIVGPLEDMVEESGILNQELVKSRLVLMYRNSQRLKHLIDQILDVSKLNADALRLTFQPVNLAALTQQITGQFQSLLEQEKISLAFYSDSITEQTFVDMEAWERIIINLMTNAIKFSPKQSSIKIGIEDCDDALKIKVKDEGTGIAEEHQAKIFDYLYQVEGARAVEGTGIGLFLVKGLVQQMGGSVELKSEIGKG